MVHANPASVVGLGFLAALGWAAIALGADPPSNVRTGANVGTGSKVVAATTFRASKLTGLYVRNHQGEKLGTIDDLVIHLPTGRVAYAAVGVGGVVGIGEKLFAIPFSAMTFEHGKDEMHFVIDMPKEKLQAAPGFDKHDWPNFADPNWAERIDNYYRNAETKTGQKTTVIPKNVTTE